MSIFKDNGDKEKFLQRLGENIDKGNAFVYAWAVMDNHDSVGPTRTPIPESFNHAHLLFKSGKHGIPF